MYRLLSYILILAYINTEATDSKMKTADNYGPYYVEWEHFDICRGPKMANLTNYKTNMIKSANNTYRGTLNVTYMDNTRIDEIKMSVFTIKNNVKTLLWNYIVNKPCQHYMLAAVLEMQLRAYNCIVKKGYYFMDLDLTTLMPKYLGNSFFYGDYLFKVLVLSKKGNIVCLIFDPKFKEKKKN